MQGILESLLITLYGKPNVVQLGPFVESRWNDKDQSRCCVLHKSLDWDIELERRLSPLKSLYGDVVGGFILGNSLKISMLRGPEVWGLYQVEELQSHSLVLRALSHDPNVCFFMDAANVWFYGVKDERLYVYDSDQDELDALGPIESELKTLVCQWDDVKS